MADVSWIGGAVQGTAGILGSILQFFGNRETNSTNQNIANQNLDFQRENLDYEKALQQQIFAREDNAYQRTVNDMRLAGLNPLSMQGTNGAGEAIATEPMHNDYQAQNVMNGVFDILNQYMNLANNTTVSNAQSNLINAQADSARVEAKYKEAMLLKELDSLDLDNAGKAFSNERSNIAWLNDINNYAFNRQFGVSDNMPEWLKAINIARHQGSLPDDWISKFNRSNGGFGSTFNYENQNPTFTTVDSLLKDVNLKGAVMENELGKIFFKLLGIK